MISALLKIPAYKIFRLTGFPRKLPMNLTASVSYNCNSRCKTCNVYKKTSEELSAEEWGRIFKSLGRNIFWATISGGEPFLRPDLADIVSMLYIHCRPYIINIPTNGLLTERIIDRTKEIANNCRKAQLVINLSVDEIGERHDEIRGVPGSYDRVLKTFAALRSLNIPNLSIGLHTVISRFNVKRIPYIYAQLRTLCPDSYITEIAEEREELGTIGSGITPEYTDYASAVNFLSHELRSDRFNRVGKITRAFRLKYYEIAKKIMIEKRQVIPCYSGFASSQVSPNGDIWMCCVKAISVGNLRDADYNFSKLWFSEKAEELRSRIKKGECFCPLANAGYTNMLHNLKTLACVGCNLIGVSADG